MLKKIIPIYWCVALFSFAYLFLGFSGGPGNSGQFRTGAPGAPDNGTTCTACHGGGTYQGAVSLTIDGNPTNITPGETYTLNLTVNYTVGTPFRAGFQLVAVQNNAGVYNNTGTLTAGTGSQKITNNASGRSYVEHNSTNFKNFTTNAPNNEVTWVFQWQAPDGSGGNGNNLNDDITFYFVGNIANGGGSSGDVIVTNTVTRRLVAGLPIELASFDATQKGHTALLTWKTYSEVNHSHFEVEHSTEGRNFEVLTKIQGIGNSTTIQSYSYRHQKMVDGTNYYRLKQVNRDGTFEYSKVVTLEYKGQTTTIFPNPVQDYLNLEVDQGVVIKEIRLFNSQGQLRNRIHGQISSMDVTDLESGLYLLSIAFENGTEATHRFLKQ